MVLYLFIFAMEYSAGSVCLIDSRLATSTKQTSYIFSFFLSFLPYCLTSSAGIPPLLGCRQTAAGEGSCPYYYFISVTLLPFATRLPVSACFLSMSITRQTSPSQWCEDAACLCTSVPASATTATTRVFPSWIYTMWFACRLPDLHGGLIITLVMC